MERERLAWKYFIPDFSYLLHQPKCLRPLRQVREIKRGSIRPQEHGGVSPIQDSPRQELVQNEVFAAQDCYGDVQAGQVYLVPASESLLLVLAIGQQKIDLQVQVGP